MLACGQRHSPGTGPAHLLFRRGFRYRIDIRPIPGLRRKADVVFPRLKVAVFVDGCFWHGCPEHATWPRANGEYWRRRILGNRDRDADTDSRLAAEGWLSLRVWEHEEPAAAAERARCRHKPAKIPAFHSRSLTLVFLKLFFPACR